MLPSAAATVTRTVVTRALASARLHPSLFEFARHSAALSHIDVESIIPKDVQQVLETEPRTKETYDDSVLTIARWVNGLFADQMSAPTSESAYTPAALNVYDALVWGFNSPYLWRIRQDQIQDLYNECLLGSKKHCEIAVGTGLFLANLEETSLEHVTLLDLKPDTMEACEKRLLEIDYYRNHVQVHKVLANILDEPSTSTIGSSGSSQQLDQLVQLQPASFDSIAANFLIHCLHGGRDVTQTAFQNCAVLLKPDGVFFGSTILGHDLEQDALQAGPAALETNRHYNELGIFGNRDDTYRDIAKALHETFDDVELWRIGYCAVWKARQPKRGDRVVSKSD